MKKHTLAISIILLVLIFTLFCGCIIISNINSNKAIRESLIRLQEIFTNISNIKSNKAAANFSSKAFFVGKVGKGMTYDEVVLMMDREPDVIKTVKERTEKYKENAIEEFKEKAYQFLHLEEYSYDKEGRTEENIEYYLPGYDYIDDVLSDYYDRRLSGEFNTIQEYRSAIIEEEHEEDWLKASEFVLWKFTTWTRKYNMDNVTFEQSLWNLKSDIYEMYGEYSLEGFLCIWYNHSSTGSGVAELDVWFNSDKNATEINAPQMIID